MPMVHLPMYVTCFLFLHEWLVCNQYRKIRVLLLKPAIYFRVLFQYPSDCKCLFLLVECIAEFFEGGPCDLLDIKSIEDWVEAHVTQPSTKDSKPISTTPFITHVTYSPGIILILISEVAVTMHANKRRRQSFGKY